jgi:hypothetical protein
VVVLLLLAAASYEAAIALGWLSVGPLPGDGPPAEETILLGAVAVHLAGAALAAGQAVKSGVSAAGAEAGIPVAAAAFVTARFYTFDPYYAPTLRRMSDQGFVAPWWVFTLVGCALVAGMLMRIRPRVGLTLTAVLLPLLALTAFAMGLGH